MFSRLLVDITPARESVAFRRLLIGSALSGIGGQMTNYAVLLQVYELTRSSLNVGIVGLASGLPMIVAALLSGPLADAIDRRKTAGIATVIQTAVSATLAAQAFAGLDQIWLLYLLVGVQGMVAGVASPARRTFMPSLLEPRAIVRRGRAADPRHARQRAGRPSARGHHHRGVWP